MKVLLTGATGYVGRHLLESWKENDWEINAISRNASAIKTIVSTSVQLYDIDICNQLSITELIDKTKPNIIVHTAAMSKPNDCEIEQELCYANNVSAAKQLAELAAKQNAYFIFLSTDFVFSDKGFYKETDEYCPVNYYGKSKQLAEEAIIKSGCNYSIIRVVLVYGKVLIGQRPTFLQWVKTNLEANKTMEIYTDQLRTPCYVKDLCWAINQLIKTKQTGVFHICGDEIFTPFSLAKAIAAYLKLDDSIIFPTDSIQKPELAKRPTNATLCIDKAKTDLGFQPTKMTIALREIFG